MSDDDERTAITAAMRRLLAGKPLQSSGDLTVVALADEAGLRRNKLTHKHTDLKDLFYAEVKARNGIPFSEVKLRGQITALQARIERPGGNATTAARRLRRSRELSTC